MTQTDIVVIGAGAAGIAAARTLHDGGVDYRLIEARDRLGGRAFSMTAGGHAVDLGCGWFHSGDVNPWRGIAERQGRTIDKTPPPWSRPSLPAGFPVAEQTSFFAARQAFDERIDAFGDEANDRPVSDFLAPGERWNALIGAVNTYVSGAEAEHVSARDLALYADTGVNWRAPDGLGTVIATHAAGLRATVGCAVHRIDHSGTRLSVETERGAISCRAVIVTLPSAILAAQPDLFHPALPAKVAAADGVPLGLDDKLFVSLTNAEEFEPESRLFGAKDRVGTGVYHLRPFGRPLIECYYGGACADALEAGGEAAFFDFAREELTGLLGHDFARRIAPLPMHLWRADPFSRGAYSYARPGEVACRAALSAPVDGRLFFAGEACSRRSYSTAHGAYETGLAAAHDAMAALGVARSRSVLG